MILKPFGWTNSLIDRLIADITLTEKSYKHLQPIFYFVYMIIMTHAYVIIIEHANMSLMLYLLNRYLLITYLNKI